MGETLGGRSLRAVSLHALLGSSCHGPIGLGSFAIALEGGTVGSAQGGPVDLLAQRPVGHPRIMWPGGGVRPAVDGKGDVRADVVGQCRMTRGDRGLAAG